MAMVYGDGRRASDERRRANNYGREQGGGALMVRVKGGLIAPLILVGQ